jgi:uncharacterized protein YqhQ
MAKSAATSGSYGGQAVIEGVMIRGPRHMAIAVRAPDGRIITRGERLPGVLPSSLRKLPLVRGMIVLYETLTLGVRALTWSSQVAAGHEQRDVSRAQLLLSLAFTLVFVGAVFFVGPVLVTGWIGELTGSHWLEVLAECALRVVMIVGYIWLVGRLPDVQRVFAYHAAEHRAIHAYEHGAPLTPESVIDYPNAHARCGTAFLLTVGLVSLFAFVALGTPPLWVRLIERIILIPAIASLAYELLRLGQAFDDNRLVRPLYRPNIWLQQLTTRNPDDAQIEVAIAALEHALALDPAAQDTDPSRAPSAALATLPADRP